MDVRNKELYPLQHAGLGSFFFNGKLTVAHVLNLQVLLWELFFIMLCGFFFSDKMEVTIDHFQSDFVCIRKSNKNVYLTKGENPLD